MLRQWRGNAGAFGRRMRRRLVLGFFLLVVVAVGILGGGALLAASFIGGQPVLRGLVIVVAGLAIVGVVRQVAGRVLRPVSEAVDATEASRRALLADLAHELRSPMTVLRANVEGMLDGVYEPEPDRLQLLLDEVETMDRLLADLATLSTAEANALRLDRRPTNVAELVGSVIAGLEPRAAEGEVLLGSALGDGLGEVKLDEVRIRQVLTNVVANAIRHSPRQGTVIVRARRDGDLLTLVVEDVGDGFDPELLGVAFERFVRSDRGGTGLGLAVAKSLVEAHGGTIEARNNTSGPGATVRILLPIGGSSLGGRKLVRLD